MDHAWKVLALSIGGVLGVNARYWLGLWMNQWASPKFPWATFTINVTGSFAIGFLTIVLARWLPNANARLFLITGLLGGYTTFSAYSFESLSMGGLRLRLRERSRRTNCRHPRGGTRSGRRAGGRRAGRRNGEWAWAR